MWNTLRIVTALGLAALAATQVARWSVVVGFIVELVIYGALLLAVRSVGTGDWMVLRPLLRRGDA
jgi:hypothetical protein